MMKTSLGPKVLAYPSPVWCIGSYDREGVPNVMTASWAGICCSDPPALTVSLRKATHTYNNLMHTKAYTVSVPSRNHVNEADYFGVASGRRVDKFDVSGLTAKPAEFVNAPYVEEFGMVVECQVIHTFELGLHTQFVGEIKDVKVDEELLGQNGLPSLHALSPIIYAAEDRTYYSIGEEIGTGFKTGRHLAE